jgi:hypothetical protein
MTNPPIDFLGRVINLGDYVVLARSSNTMTIGKVINLEKMGVITVNTWPDNRLSLNSKPGYYCCAGQMIIINDAILKEYKDLLDSWKP